MSQGWEGAMALKGGRQSRDAHDLPPYIPRHIVLTLPFTYIPGFRCFILLYTLCYANSNTRHNTVFTRPGT